MNPDIYFTSELFQGLAAGLINSLIPSLVLTAAATLILKFMRGLSPADRYGIWWGVLVLVAAFPIICAGYSFTLEQHPAPLREMKAEEPVGIFSDLPPSVKDPAGISETGRAEETTRADNSVAVGTPSLLYTYTEAPEIPPSWMQAPVNKDRLLLPLRVDEKALPMIPSNQDRWNPFIINIHSGTWVTGVAVSWLLISGFLILRLCWKWTRLMKIKARARTLDGEWSCPLAARTIAGRRRRRVRLCATHEMSTPVLAGCLDAVVLIPESMLPNLSEKDLQRIWLHENAHLHRWDDWMNLLQHFLAVLLFYNPAAWWIGRQLNHDREAACDDWVIWQTGRRRAYASCLLRLMEASGRMQNTVPAPGVIQRQSRLKRRIQMILDKKRRVRPAAMRTLLVVVFGILILVAIPLGRASTMILITDAPELAAVSDVAPAIASVAEPNAPAEKERAASHSDKSAVAASIKQAKVERIEKVNEISEKSLKLAEKKLCEINALVDEINQTAIQKMVKELRLMEERLQQTDIKIEAVPPPAAAAIEVKTGLRAGKAVPTPEPFPAPKSFPQPPSVPQAKTLKQAAPPAPAPKLSPVTEPIASPAPLPVPHVAPKQVAPVDPAPSVTLRPEPAPKPPLPPKKVDSPPPPPPKKAKKR